MSWILTIWACVDQEPVSKATDTVASGDTATPKPTTPPDTAPTGDTAADAVCGNGVVEGDEECDDGDDDDTDACPSSCVEAFCGDGFVWAGVEECDDGDAEPDDGCEPDCTGSRNVAFVTSTAVVPGSLGGLAGADAFCADRAAAAGIPGTFRAWLSSTTVDARDRLGAARGWVRPDGRPVVDTVEDLVANGPHLYPLTIDELGQTVIGARVVTATNGLDSRVEITAERGTCDDWTSTGGRATGAYNDAQGIMWQDYASVDCIDSAHLYCFGVDHDTVLPSPPAPKGRIAFVSTGIAAGSGGLAGLDARCQADAANHGLPTTVLALAATSNASAASRFDPTGSPWFRPDGVQVVGSASDLATGDWQAAINLQADGLTYLGNYGANTGAPDPASLASTNCDDWSDRTGNLTVGIVGRVGPAAFAFFADSPSCNNSLSRVYCLEP